MNERHRRFVEAFLVLGRAREAAIRAGYAPRAAHGTANKLLRHPAIAAAIRDGLAAQAERHGITPERVLTELARVAFSDLGQVVDWGPDGVQLKPRDEVPLADRAAVAELSSRTGKRSARVRIRLHDKKRALDSLARHLNLFASKHPAAPDAVKRIAEGERVAALVNARLAARVAAEKAEKPADPAPPEPPKEG